jgi:lysine-N-methylase
MLEHLRPQYARNFHCSGSGCEDNCCRTWEVVIERAIYQRYERTPALRPRLSENFTLITNGATEDRHALIRYTSANTCPFLSGDKLCSLQQHYGEDYLSDVCRNYPRNAHRVEGLMELPLSLSCIEAARLVLLQPQLMTPYDLGPSRYSRFLRMSSQGTPQSEKDFRYFWDVREFCLLLVQDRDHPLWQRLFLLGTFCRRFGEVVGARHFALVPKLLRDFSEIISSGSLRSSMESLPVRLDPQVQMVLQVALIYLRQRDPRLCRIQESLRDFLEGIGFDANVEADRWTRNYAEAYAHYYCPLMEQHPYLLENYLINHIFRVVFPFGLVPAESFERPQKEFLQMCLEFAAIKGLLIGLAGHYRENFGTGHVVTLIQRLAKSMEHDPGFGRAINWNGLSDPSCVAALLKN